MKHATGGVCPCPCITVKQQLIPTISHSSVSTVRVAILVCCDGRHPAPVDSAFIPLFRGYIPGGCLGFLPSTVCPSHTWLASGIMPIIAGGILVFRTDVRHRCGHRGEVGSWEWTPGENEHGTGKPPKVSGTLQGTNISPKHGILKMIFLLPTWDMLIPWRVPKLEGFQITWFAAFLWEWGPLPYIRRGWKTTQ